jgi:polyphosphate kinase 2 (PPK2 family)
MARKEYEQVKRRLQIELLKLQNWSKRTGATRDRVRGP